MSRQSALAVVLLVAIWAPAAPGRDSESDSRALKAVHARLAPSVVHVRAVVRVELSNGRSHGMETEFTGLVVDGDGLVLVPGALIEEGTSLGANVESVEVIVAGGERFGASYVGKDAARDLCFVRVRNPERQAFPGVPVEFAADDELGIGDFVASVRLVGRSFGWRPYIEAFMISAEVDEPDRCFVTSFAVSDYLGSAVATMDGRIVGIIGWMNLRESAVLRDPVSGAERKDLFAPVFGSNPQGREIVVMPASFVVPAIEDPPTDASVGEQPGRSAFLGVEVQALLPELREALGLADDVRGVLVTRVLPGSPAERAGLAVADLIHSADGTDVEVARESDTHLFGAFVQRHGPGDEIEFGVCRDTHDMAIRVTLGEAPLTVGEATTARSAEFGITARDLVYVDRVERHMAMDHTGAMVTAVSPTGLAGLAGLRVGDIIIKVGERDIRGADSLIEALADPAENRTSFFILRDRDTSFLHLGT